MTRLAHTLLDEERVLVRGLGQIEHVVSKGDLRRFCWAVLADLDPAEAMRAADEDDDLLEAMAGRAQTLTKRILGQLLLGPATSADIARAVDAKTTIVSATLTRLYQAGEVRRTVEKHCATWFLPDRDGRAS